MVGNSKMMKRKGEADPEQMFQRLEHIGRGSFGEVYKGINKKLSNIVAIKIIDLEKTEDEIEDIQQEIQVLSQCNSQYVTKYFGSYLKGTKLWIVMEYLGGGSALDLMKPGVFNEKYIAIILREVLKGLEYLHSEKKIHRDVKAANILLSENGDVKLADFGVAKQLTESMGKVDTFVGTPFWMPPEIIMQHKYDYSADIWSLGITGIELAKGQPPNSDLHPMRALMQIPKIPPPQLYGKEYSEYFREFVEACLQKNPEHRPTAAQMRRFKFVSTTKSTKYLIDLVVRYQNWKKKNEDGVGSDNESNSDDDQTKDKSDDWIYGEGTVKLASNHTPSPHSVVSYEPNPLFRSIFDDLSVRFDIPSSNNRSKYETHPGAKLFQHLRHLFSNHPSMYPRFSDDFTRSMREHLLKSNDNLLISAKRPGSTTNANNGTSTVVKITI